MGGTPVTDTAAAAPGPAASPESPKSPIVFGTDGWRARIADEFTFDNVRRCADGLARYVVGRGEQAKGVVIAYDRATWQVDGTPTHITVVDAGGPDWPMILDLSTWYGAPVVVGFATGARGRELAGKPESARIAARIGVSISPGDTVFTRTGESASASPRPRLSTAALMHPCSSASLFGR